MISEIATVTTTDAKQPRPLNPQKNKSSSSSSSSKPWLRHTEDVRMLGCTGLFFAVFVFAWISYTSPLSGGLVSFVTWLALFQLSFMGAVATHNAIHVPVFWKPWLNNCYQICLSLQYGFPVSVFVPGHNLSHHKYPQQARDISELQLRVILN